MRPNEFKCFQENYHQLSELSFDEDEFRAKNYCLLFQRIGSLLWLTSEDCAENLLERLYLIDSRFFVGSCPVPFCGFVFFFHCPAEPLLSIACSFLVRLHGDPMGFSRVEAAMAAAMARLSTRDGPDLSETMLERLANGFV